MYYMALWLDSSKGVWYDFKTSNDIPVDSQNVKIELSYIAPSINVYKPLLSAGPLYTRSSSDTVTVKVPDHVVIIEIAAPTGFAKNNGSNEKMIQANPANEITTFPNPFTENFTLRLKEPEDVVIYNSVGQLIYRKKLSRESYNIDMGNMARDVYYLISAKKDHKIKLVKM
jgi:hypothetical protein